MTSIADDLTKLSPKRLVRRLEELSREALLGVSASVFDGNPRGGLTVGLWLESQGRRDVLEPRGHVATAWSLLHPGRDEPLWHLLVRVDLQRPVSCAFVVRLDVLRCGSTAGERTIERLLSASLTCRLQRRSLFAYLADVLSANIRGNPIPLLT